MKKIGADLKRMLAAMACADAGEMLSYRAKTRMIAPGVTADAPPIAPPARRLVVLSLGTSLRTNVIEYAIETCRRVAADLIAVCADAEQAETLLAPHRVTIEQAGIACTTTALVGDITTAMRQLLDRNLQIMFVVSAGDDDPAQKLLDASARLDVPPVPIVVVTNS